MPIKRLQRDAQFPCIGKLRKGAKRPTNGKAPGKDLNHFRFDTNDERADAVFTAAYGPEPSEVEVFLPHPTTDQNFSTWQEHWTAGALQHRCDGEDCTIWLQDDGTYSQEPKACPGGCKEVGRLMVILPALQRFAFVTVETHSINDIIRLTEQLQAVESLRGSLQSIPFVLRRTPVEISAPSGTGGKRARRETWLLSIEVSPVWAALQLTSMQQSALSVDAPIGMIEDFGDDDDLLIESLDEVPELNPNGSGPQLPSKELREFKQSIEKLFPKDSEDACRWLVKSYTAKATPSNIREEGEDLIDSELSAINAALAKHGESYQARYEEHVASLFEVTA